MKAFILKHIASHISDKHFIKRVIRIDDNVVLFEIDKTKYFFDLTKGNSDIYINIDYELSKKFNAPFDIILTKKFTKSKLLDVKVKERILTLKIETNLSFKKEINYVQFEFTGRYTNIIILNENFIILEALHHINQNVSFRPIQPHLKLVELPSKQINENIFEIDNIEDYTKTLFKEKFENRLNQIKTSQINMINKKLKKLNNILDTLESEEELLQKSVLYKAYADLAMINLHKITNKYKSYLEVQDFDGTPMQIPIPKLRNINKIGDYYYQKSKRMKNKAINIKMEKKSLLDKIEYFNNYKKGIQKASCISELNIYKSPKKSKIKEDNIEQFFIDDFIVLVGKNEKGNIKLLKESKANDIWFHIKDKKGAHLIIKTNKKNVPNDVIINSAKLVLLFSGENEGVVDYTPRRHLYIQEGAFVNYVTYKSIKVRI